MKPMQPTAEAGSPPRIFRVSLSAFLVLTLAHVLIFVWGGSRLGKGLGAVLEHWDAGWYLKIAREGYDASSSAFLPLYPLILQLFSFDQAALMPWVGSLFSFICFTGVLYLLSANRQGEPQLTWGGVWLLILTPASYIFHTAHTESLFLLLSLLAFADLEDKRWIRAAVWAGLASLLRHQGVFLAIAIAVGWAVQGRGGLRGFISIGLISGLIWSLTPLYHLGQGRGAFPAFSAHSTSWYLADSVGAYFKTFILANPIQNYRPGSFLHHIFYFIWLGAAFVLFKRRYWAAAAYCLLSLLVMPLQGELVDAFRFGAVLFPVIFLLGEKLSALPRTVYLGILTGSTLLNLLVAWQYATMRWAY